MPSEPEPTSSEVFAEWRQAHQDYRAALPHMKSIGADVVQLPGDPVIAKAALAKAYLLRLEMERRDSAHVDPAWRGEPLDLHRKLLAFYQQQMA